MAPSYLQTIKDNAALAAREAGRTVLQTNPLYAAGRYAAKAAGAAADFLRASPTAQYPARAAGRFLGAVREVAPDVLAGGLIPAARSGLRQLGAGAQAVLFGPPARTAMPEPQPAGPVGPMDVPGGSAAPGESGSPVMSAPAGRFLGRVVMPEYAGANYTGAGVSPAELHQRNLKLMEETRYIMGAKTVEDRERRMNDIAARREAELNRASAERIAGTQTAGEALKAQAAMVLAQQNVDLPPGVRAALNIVSNGLNADPEIADMASQIANDYFTKQGATPTEGTDLDGDNQVSAEESEYNKIKTALDADKAGRLDAPLTPLQRDQANARLKELKAKFGIA